MDEHGWYTHKVSLFLVMGMTAIAAIWTGIVNVHQQSTQQQLKDNQHQQEISQTCTEKALTALVTSLNERTSLTSDLNNANKDALAADQEQTVAFARLIAAVLRIPPLPEAQARAIFVAYQKSLSKKQETQNKYLGLLEAQRKAQLENPFPQIVNYKDCLKKGK
jgi:hypothetical protein